MKGTHYACGGEINASPGHSWRTTIGVLIALTRAPQQVDASDQLTSRQVEDIQSSLLRGVRPRVNVLIEDVASDHTRGL